MQKKMTQWTAVFLLLGGLTFLGSFNMYFHSE